MPPSFPTKPYSITGPGPFEAGVDMQPGVYVADRGCSAWTAKTADWDVMDDGADPDEGIAAALVVAGVERIEVHRGEFFRSYDCKGWRREDGSQPRTPDPATIDGACTILRQGQLIPRAIDAIEAHPRAEEATGDGYEIQDALTPIVFSTVRASGDLKELGNEVGDFVDYLDAPTYFVNAEGMVEGNVRRSAERIRSICREQ